MKKNNNNEKINIVREPHTPYIRTFSSQDEAERFNMIENVEMSDMEKFRLFCRMMRIGKMLATAKVVK